MEELSIEVLDSTLRDGAQNEGVNFSIHDKELIAKALFDFGITYVEGGTPTSSTAEFDFFVANKDARLCAFTSTRRKDETVEESKAIKGVLECGAQTVVVFGKSSLLHVYEVLKTTKEDNLEMISSTIKCLKKHGKKVIFDAEHFFDGYKESSEYAIQVLKKANEAGADVLCLCDTNGGAIPTEVKTITEKVCTMFKGKIIGIHCHDDAGLATANTILAVRGGARHIQGTFVGIGERCGNANLSTLIPTLQLKCGYKIVPEHKLATLCNTAKTIAELANVRLNNALPYIGKSAFAHKAGMHVDGVLKNSTTFEHVDPNLVGNERRFLLSEFSGRGVVCDKLKELYPRLNKESEEIARVSDCLKNEESNGMRYEGAEASFYLLAKKVIENYTPPFKLVKYKYTSEKPTKEDFVAKAKLEIVTRNGKRKKAVGVGSGPVHALDTALRAALKEFFPIVESIKLVDYKVRVITDNATAAKVRVLITSADVKETWSTVGVSADIVEASWLALVDSFEWKILNIK